MSFHQILQTYPVPTRALDDAAAHVLSDKALAKLPPTDKPQKISDGGGLYLHCLPSGVRTWRFKYRFAGKVDELTIGRFPEVTLAEARADGAALRRLIAAGSDPKSWAAERQAEADRALLLRTETFRVAAKAYFLAASRGVQLDPADQTAPARDPAWSDTHQRDVRRILRELIDGRPHPAEHPHAGIGDVPIRDLRKSHIRPIIEAISARGAHSYVRDVLLYARQVVEHFNASHDDDQLADPTRGLRDALPDAPPEKHHQSLKPAEMPAFLRAVRLTSCEPETRLGLRLLLLTAVRTGELREAQWTEFDTERRIWTIPAERMKYRRKIREDHLVPLSDQALAALDDLRSLTGHRTLILPGVGEGKPISEGTLLSFIKRAGYNGRMTGHGCRSVFSTWANEAKFHADAIERQLSHIEENRVRAAYNNAEHWEERAAMMTAWGAQIDEWDRASVQLRGVA